MPERKAEDWSDMFTALLMIAAGNALLPLFLDLGAMSNRGHSMRAITSGATLVFDVVLFLAVRNRLNIRLMAESVVIAVLSIGALATVRWSALGWGTVGVLGLFLVPAVSKLSRRMSE